MFYYNVEKNTWSVPRFDRELTRLLNPESDPDFDGDLDIDAYSDIYSETSAADDRNEPKPAPVCRHACCLAEDGHSMYVSGGQCDVEEVSSQLFRYDFETERWTALRDFVARYDHIITAYNRKIWAFGGLSPEMDKCTDVVWYDLDSDAVGYINIIDDPMLLSYPTPSAATHGYTPGYSGTVLDVSLPGFATQDYPLSVTAIDLVTLKRRNIVHSSYIFSEYTWYHIFSLGPAFVILGTPGTQQSSDPQITHMFYWDLREFGFLDPHAQNEPDEREGTLSYDLLHMFRDGILADFEITCVQGDERPSLFHNVIQPTEAPPAVSTPSYPYELSGSTVLDSASPAPSLHSAEGVLGDGDSISDLAIPNQPYHSSGLKSASSVNLVQTNPINPGAISTAIAATVDVASQASGSSGDIPSTIADQQNPPAQLSRSQSLQRQLANAGTSVRAYPYHTGRNDLPMFKQSLPIRVHSLILYSRWPHFRRIMQSGMSEVRARNIYIPEPVTWVRKLVEYIYSDSVSSYTVNDVAALLILSNLYELPRLRRLCLEHISKSSVTAQNAVIVYWRAQQAAEYDLQKTAASYCLQHWSQIVRTPEFEALPRDILVMLCQEASSTSIMIPKMQVTHPIYNQSTSTVNNLKAQDSQQESQPQPNILQTPQRQRRRSSHFNPNYSQSSGSQTQQPTFSHAASTPIASSTPTRLQTPRETQQQEVTAPYDRSTQLPQSPFPRDPDDRSLGTLDSRALASGLSIDSSSSTVAQGVTITATAGSGGQNSSFSGMLPRRYRSTSGSERWGQFVESLNASHLPAAPVNSQANEESQSHESNEEEEEEGDGADEEHDNYPVAGQNHDDEDRAGDDEGDNEDTDMS